MPDFQTVEVRGMRGPGLSGADLALLTNAEDAADAAIAAGRYYSTQTAGEAATTAGQLFCCPDGAGGLFWRERAATGSTLIGNMATQSQLNAFGADGGAGLVGYRAPGSPAASTVHDKLLQTISVEDFHPAGDGVGDDSGAFTAAIAALGSRGGNVLGGAGRSYFLANPPVIPRGVRLIGATVLNKDRATLPAPNRYASSIILPPGKTLTVVGAEIAGWLFWRQGLATPSSEAGFDAGLASWAGTAITASGDDPHVHHNLFIGFALAGLFNGAWRPEVYENGVDCLNGFEVTQVFDCGNRGVSHNRFYPYLTANADWSWASARRSGKALYIHDGADGLRAEGNFAYGYAVGLHLKNVFGVKASAWIDGPAQQDAASGAGTIGILTEGDVNSCSIAGSHVDGQERSYVLDHTGQPLQMGSNTSGSALLHQVALGAGSCGDLGSMMVSGSCDTPVVAASGVERWTGRVYCNSTASGSNGVIGFDQNDRDKLREIRLVQKSATLPDNLSGGAFTVPSIKPHPALDHGIFLPDGNTLGVAVGTRNVMHFVTEGSSVNHLRARASNTGGPAVLEAIGTDNAVSLRLQPQNAGDVQIGSNLIPIADNAYSIGRSGARVTAIWAANGAIQTSDPAQKTDIAQIDPATALLILQMIDPITFKWKVGGQVVQMVDQTVEEPDTEAVQDYEDVVTSTAAGQAVVERRAITVQRPIIDMLDVIDATTGQPVMITQPAVVRGGIVLTPEQQVPLRKPVQRMRQVTRSVPQLVDRAGDRTHWGFNARQVKAAFDAMNLDFGGFITADDGSCALRPDQLIPVLWAALRAVLAGTASPPVPTHPDYLTGASG